MFKFATHIKSERSRRSAAGKSANEVGAVLIGSPIIMHNGFGEVIAIGERLAGDARDARVHRIKLGVMLLIGSIQLRSKLASQRGIEPRHLVSRKVVSVF